MIHSSRGPRLGAAVEGLAGSATMAAAAARTAHPWPIQLGIGEPCESPAEFVVEAAARAARDGLARYGPAAGLPRLRELAARDQWRKSGLPRGVDEVLVTAGGKPALLDGLRCMLDAGDEVLVLAPYWPSFLQQVELAGGRARIVPAGADGLPDPGRIAATCTPRTRALILNDPCNPSSRCLSDERLRAIGQVARRHELWILADQVYADLVLDGPPASLLRAAPELRERTLVVESFSKRFAMSGYRLGYAAGPRALIEAMTRLATASTTCVNALAQYAGIAALTMDERWIDEQRARYRVRRDWMHAQLSALGWPLGPRPEAAFYLLLPLGEGVDDLAAARALREQEGLSLVAGSAFGAPGHLRLACSAPLEELVEAARLLARARGHDPQLVRAPPTSTSRVPS